MTTREFIAENYPDSILWDGFDDAIIGVSDGAKTIYDINKMVDILMEQWKTDLRNSKLKTEILTEGDAIPEDLTEEDAFEYLEFNVLCSYVGELTPVHVWTIPKNE